MSSTTGASPAPEPVVRLLPQLLDFAARRHGGSPFLLRWTAAGWQAMSCAEAALGMRAFAALLRSEGVTPGARVALQSENRPEWGLAWLAILEAGGIVVPLDAQLKAEEVGEILRAAGATHCVVSARQQTVLEQARATAAPGIRLVSLDPVAGLPSWEDARRRFSGAPDQPAPGSPGDPAVLIFTSGTTGQAKGVMLSHSNLLHNVEAVARAFEFGPGDRFLSVLPLHHTFESTAGFLCPLRVGASVAYARALDSRTLREDAATSGATILLGVPLLYEKMLSAIHRGIAGAPPLPRLAARAALGVARLLRLVSGLRAGGVLLRAVREQSGFVRIRMFVSGAAPLPPEVFWGFVDLGWSVLEGYGLTETSPVVSANRPHASAPGSVGPPLPGVEVRIEAPDAHGDGEIAVRGPNVMLGYYQNPAATAEVLRGGWLHTGDLGRLLPDGRLRVTGRIKNMIATAAGKKIYPEEIELRLADSPLVLEVVVVGGRGPRGEREEVQAHVYPDLRELEALARARGRECDEAFVEEAIRLDVEARCARLAPYKRVKRVIVRRKEFPKTTTGKIRRQDVAAAAPAKRPGAAA